MSKVIEYQFRGKLNINLLAKNMRDNKTPFAIVLTKHDRPALFILKAFHKRYRGEDMPLTSFCFFTTYNMFIEINEDSLITNPFYFNKEYINEVLSNIKAIIKSHEDACLPVVKVIAVETTDWGGK
ncbi:MAG TPA: hypothetical protein ENH82_18520 [bacterium]|nr:hypothetical protein [bacterium]